MSQLVVIVAIEIAILVAVIVLREPKLLILAVVLGLPFEYAGEKLIPSLGTTGLSGAVRALLNPGKAAMLATICYAVFQFRHEPRRLLPNSSTVVPIVGLLAVVVLGVAWSDSLKPNNTVLIMPMYVAFACVAPNYIQNRRDIEWLIGAILLTTIGLSLLAIAQRFAHVFNWRSILIDSDGYSYRSNATFSDPNIMARYFALSLSLAGALILATGPRRTTLYLAVPAIVFGSVALLATGSRSGWATLLLCSAIVLWTTPIQRGTKVKLTIVSVGTVALAVALVLFQGGGNAERIKSFSNPVVALGQRDFLIAAGWHMFLDHRLLGVGSGNYQHSLLLSYRADIPSWAEVTLSHTSVISLLAELGMVGFGFFLFVVFRLGGAVVRAYRATTVRFDRLMIGWLGASMIGIFFSSQSEGRLLDEPYFYLVLAMFIAIETGQGFAARTVTTPMAAEMEAQASAGARHSADGSGTSDVGSPVPVPARPRGAEIGATPIITAD